MAPICAALGSETSKLGNTLGATKHFRYAIPLLTVTYSAIIIATLNLYLASLAHVARPLSQVRSIHFHWMAHSVFTAFANVQCGMRYKQESHTLTVLPRIDFTVTVVKLAELPDPLRFRSGTN